MVKKPDRFFSVWAVYDVVKGDAARERDEALQSVR